MQISEDQKLMFAALGVLVVLSMLALAIGGIFRACDNRQLRKTEANVKQAANAVEESEKEVQEQKRQASEANGELNIRKEVREEANVEVNAKIQERRQAANNSNRVRSDRIANVNRAEFERILDEADSNR